MNHWNVFLGSSTFEVAIFIAPPTSRQAFPANLPSPSLPLAFPAGGQMFQTFMLFPQRCWHVQSLDETGTKSFEIN